MIHIINILILIAGYLYIRYGLCKDDYDSGGSSYINLDGLFGSFVMLIWTIIWLVVFYVFDLKLI